MWKRLSDADISKAGEEEERRRRRWRGPVLTAVLMAAVVAVLWSFGFRGNISSGVVLMEPATRLTDPSTLAVFTIVFGLVLYQSRRKMIRNGQGLFGGAPAVLCDRCQQPETAGASPACECGGSWEPIHHYQWIDRTN
jgi:hypothetical protein